MNSNHVLIGNGRLPYEVLIQVFDYYLEHETALYPIETLLLVCKAWSEAASGRPSLWATYRIKVGDETITKLWVHRLPLRLRQSGSHIPLYIDITSPPNNLPDNDSWFSSPIFTGAVIIRNADYLHTLKLLEILAGKDGRLCSRWKSLRLLLASALRIEDGAEELIYPLTYPMPALQSLHLTLRCRYSGSVPLNKRRVLFPELPSLESITLATFHMENYPDMSHARRITFHRGYALEGGIRRRGLFNAPNVEILSIFHDGFGFNLPDVYPTLRKLILTGPKLGFGLETVSMPCLEELIIQYSKHMVLEEAANLQDIGRIHTIHLTAAPPIQPTHDRRPESRAIGALLGVCQDLRTLKADEYVLSLILKDWKHYLQPTSPLRVVFAKNSGEDREIDIGDVSPTLEWNRIVELANASQDGS
ncbi:hypothetical protein FRC14_005754 [Serendipita sp. 396]|nr:hypothetical protein FRC14_005754 [Serendipita sp. 396]KAG8828401.1 hypothetical protein FRC19_006499 [Serendipita sp. 401]KAG8865580.1 hypothetical protein FRC20_009681 [Serendipita sp. 405]KAG9058491.1 hypothetical protein FS842_008788 [Serendipita sp. 407]